MKRVLLTVFAAHLSMIHFAVHADQPDTLFCRGTGAFQNIWIDYQPIDAEWERVVLMDHPQFRISAFAFRSNVDQKRYLAIQMFHSNPVGFGGNDEAIEEQGVLTTYMARSHPSSISCMVLSGEYPAARL